MNWRCFNLRRCLNLVAICHNFSWCGPHWNSGWKDKDLKMSRKTGPLKFSLRGIVWWKVTGEKRLYKNTSASKQNFTQSQRNHTAIKRAIYVPCCNFYRLVLFSVRRSGAAERLNHYLCGKRNNWQGVSAASKNEISTAHAAVEEPKIRTIAAREAMSACLLPFHRLVLPCSYVTGRDTNGSLSSPAPYEFCISTPNESWKLNGPTALMTKKHLLSPWHSVTAGRQFEILSKLGLRACSVTTNKRGQKWGFFFCLSTIPLAPYLLW